MYTITIKHEREESRFIGREWAITGKKDEKGNPEYAYTPQEKETRAVESKVYEQTVEKIELEAVIFAVNKMGRKEKI